MAYGDTVQHGALKDWRDIDRSVVQAAERIVEHGMSLTPDRLKAILDGMAELEEADQEPPGCSRNLEVAAVGRRAGTGPAYSTAGDRDRSAGGGPGAWPGGPRAPRPVRPRWGMATSPFACRLPLASCSMGDLGAPE